MPALPTTLTSRDIYDAALDMLAPRSNNIETRDFNSHSDFDEQRDRVETGQRVIGGGIIAVIVIVVIGFIASCVIGCVVFRRLQRRRKERDQMQQQQQQQPGGAYDPNMTYPNYGPQYGAGAGGQQQNYYGSSPGGGFDKGPVPEPAPAYTPPGHATGGGHTGAP